MKTVEPNVRTSILTCLVIAIVTVATWLPRMSGSIDLRWDGGAYYIVGTSLANNKGYRLLSEPGDIRSSVHAPFLPALVAAHQLILKTSDPAVVGPALRVSILLVSVGYAVAIFLFLSAYVCRPLAFTAALIGVLQPQFAYFSDALYAEMFFGLFTLLFFILQSKSKKIVYFLLSGLFAVLAYEARTAGIALLVAWVADNLLRRDFKRTFITLAIAAVPVMSWIGWIAKVESSPEYQKPAYAYQTAPYLYFNVSYAKNIFTLKDPSNPQLGPFTTQALATRVLDNLLVLPVRIGGGCKHLGCTCISLAAPGLGCAHRARCASETQAVPHSFLCDTVVDGILPHPVQQAVCPISSTSLSILCVGDVSVSCRYGAKDSIPFLGNFTFRARNSRLGGRWGHCVAGGARS